MVTLAKKIMLFPVFLLFLSFGWPISPMTLSDNTQIGDTVLAMVQDIDQTTPITVDKQYIEMLLKALQQVVTQQPGINRNELYKKVFDYQFVPEGTITEHDVQQCPKKIFGIRKIACAVSYNLLQCAYTYHFNKSVIDALACQYAIALHGSMRALQNNEQREDFIKKTDFSVLSSGVQNNFNQLPGLIKKSVLAQYQLYFGRPLKKLSHDYCDSNTIGYAAIQNKIPTEIVMATNIIDAVCTIIRTNKSIKNRVNSYVRRYVPFVSQVQWTNATWINHLPADLQTIVRKRCWCEKGKPLDDVPLMTLTVNELRELAQAGCIPQFESTNLRDIAKEWVQRYANKPMFYGWSLQSKEQGQPARWLTLLPQTLINHIKKYFYCYWRKNKKNLTLFGQEEDMHFSYYIELDKIVCPTSYLDALKANSVAFLQQLRAKSQDVLVADYVQFVKSLADHEVAYTVQLLPEFFKKLVAQKLVQNNNYSLVTQQNFGDLDLQVSLGDVLGDNNIKVALEQSIADTGTLDLSLVPIKINVIRQNDLLLVNGVQTVRTVKAHNQKISHLERGCFLAMQHLQHLDLSNNNLTTLDARFFQGMAHLKTLLLNNNDITVLSPTIFSPCTADMDVIDLSGNKLTGKSLPHFAQLKLKSLYINDQRADFGVLENRVFSQYTNANNRLCNANRLRNSLKQLECKGNQLHFANTGSSNQLWEELSKLKKLQYLDLSNNQLDRFHKILELRLLNLEYLFLSKNPLRRLYLASVPSGRNVITYPKLKVLDLSSCQLQDKVGNSVFSCSKGIKRLFLQNNKITDLQRSLTPLQDLEELYLQDNRINTIQAGITFKDVKKLKILHLEGNAVTTFPANAFSDCRDLEELYLFANAPVSAMPDGSDVQTYLPAGTFAGLSNLKYLDLSYNQINTLPRGVFDPLNKIEWINVAQNNIRALPPKIIAKLDTLKHLNLSHNKLQKLAHKSLSSDSNSRLKIKFTGNDATGLLRFFSTVEIGKKILARYIARATYAEKTKIAHILFGKGMDIDIEWYKIVCPDFARICERLYEKSIGSLMGGLKYLARAVGMSNENKYKRDFNDPIATLESQVVFGNRPLKSYKNFQEIETYYTQLSKHIRMLYTL